MEVRAKQKSRKDVLSPPETSLTLMTCTPTTMALMSETVVMIVNSGYLCA